MAFGGIRVTAQHARAHHGTTSLARRVRLAADGNHKLAVRGGYGYFFDRVNGNSVIHAVEQSPPYSLTLDNSARRWALPPWQILTPTNNSAGAILDG